MIAAIRPLLAKLGQGGRLRIRGKHVERLVELLESLARILREQGNAALAAIEALVRRTRQMQQDLAAGDQEAMSTGRLAELAEAVTKAIDDLGHEPGPPRERERFWA